ncbi:hypothetical protein ABIA32_006325 [Streptacidiphilus sp. MAP12-20]|uniref:hypothetical protein n=1 Tax=Streptacidiphilus sp. MAP12-20 TaxID=3156299 RepID=UPI0035169162
MTVTVRQAGLQRLPERRRQGLPCCEASGGGEAGPGTGLCEQDQHRHHSAGQPADEGSCQQPRDSRGAEHGPNTDLVAPGA